MRAMCKLNEQAAASCSEELTMLAEAKYKCIQYLHVEERVQNFEKRKTIVPTLSQTAPSLIQVRQSLKT